MLNWDDESARRSQWAGVVSLMLVLPAVSAWAWHQSKQVSEQRVGLEDSPAAPNAAGVVAPASPMADLAQSLSPLPGGTRVAAIIDVATRDAGVSLVRINLSEHAASSAQLARLDAELALKGSYADVKRVLTEVLARLPSATVRRLVLQGADSGPEAQGQALQATVSLVVWGPPAAVAPP